MRPEMPPPMMATSGSSEKGTVKVTCSWLKVFFRIDLLELPYDDFLRFLEDLLCLCPSILTVPCLEDDDVLLLRLLRHGLVHGNAALHVLMFRTTMVHGFGSVRRSTHQRHIFRSSLHHLLISHPYLSIFFHFFPSLNYITLHCPPAFSA